ncbi:prenyltransferase/squalene oxidase repeat-containing protein [Nocardioides stalactiti]|uniref:prenyltransferase/squalene oxidase repeat-containing protein n=1 Tax=Nocardioides stalactiti TaxID=2755356 RepID=UPI0015FEEE8F|nr:prenyltransferase/squalene oxidase repeat-containing protein [Nocardioides stalactiti]
MSTSRSTSIVRRLGAVVLGGALAVSALASPAEAHGETDRTPKAIGAGWLNDQLDDGLLHAAYADFTTGDPISYVDYGGTVEAAYALEAAGRERLLPRIAGALEDTAASYITGADFGEPGDHYAGPTGKLLSFANDFGGDGAATSFGGIDLVDRMEGMTTESGRILDTDAEPHYCGPLESPVPCDYANVFGQTWAARGLLGAGSPEAPAAVEYLLSEQCEDGHFPTYFGACNPAGPDATAFVIILLSDAGSDDPDLQAALADATAWLVDWQGRNGGLADDNGVVNANSTGLGGWAFGIAGRERAATKAAVWLRALQVPGRGCDAKLSGERGAVAYDAAAYKLGRRKGIQPLTAGQWQTVEAQALPALAHAPAADYKFAVAAPERLPAGDKVGVQVQGLAPGERACVGIGRNLRSVVGRADDRPFNVRIEVPARKGPVDVKLYAANEVATDGAVVR